ncbi:MAG TPA: hypothetical protein VK989_05025 [Polyangia bacterium]|nr:hypothetical protein [Polyangia bacterium]
MHSEAVAPVQHSPPADPHAAHLASAPVPAQTAPEAVQVRPAQHASPTPPQGVAVVPQAPFMHMPRFRRAAPHVEPEAEQVPATQQPPLLQVLAAQQAWPVPPHVAPAPAVPVAPAVPGVVPAAPVVPAVPGVVPAAPVVPAVPGVVPAAPVVPAVPLASPAVPPVVPAVPLASPALPVAPAEPASAPGATGLLLPQPTARASKVAHEKHDRVESQDVRVIW